MLQTFWNDESAFIISAELILVLTVCILGVLVCLSTLVVAINIELQDIGHAVGSLNQSFCLPGFLGCKKGGNPICFTFGSFNTDNPDDGDCVSSCDLISPGITVNSTGG